MLCQINVCRTRILVPTRGPFSRSSSRFPDWLHRLSHIPSHGVCRNGVSVGLLSITVTRSCGDLTRLPFYLPTQNMRLNRKPLDNHAVQFEKMLTHYSRTVNSIRPFYYSKRMDKQSSRHFIMICITPAPNLDSRFAD